MQSRSNKKRPAIQVDQYVDELRAFFADWGFSSGSPSDLAPVAALVAKPGAFHEEFMSMISTVVLCEGGDVPHNELRDLVLTAIRGQRERQAADDDPSPVHAVDEFIGEVIRSVTRRTSPDGLRTPAEPASAAAPLPAIVRMPRPVGVESLSTKRPEAFTAQPLKFNPIPRQYPVSSLRVDVPVTAKPIPPHRDGPVAVPVPVQPPPATSRTMQPLKENTVLTPVSSVPAVLPPDHFFRSTMWALTFGLGLALLWRHERPVGTSREEPQSHLPPSSNRALPGLPSNSAPPGNITSTIAVGGIDSTAAAPGASEVRTQPAAQPTSDAVPATSSYSFPTGLEAIPVFPGSPAGQASAPDRPKLSRRRTTPLAAPVPASPLVSPQPLPPGKQGAFLVSSGLMGASLITAPLPKYPRMASITGVEGQVVMQATISRNGTVAATHVLDGHRLLRGAALKAVRKWRYRPYVVNGRPEEIATIVTLEFRRSR